MRLAMSEICFNCNKPFVGTDHCLCHAAVQVQAEFRKLRAENERLKSKLGRVMAEVEHDHGMEYLLEIMAQVEAGDE